jgi:hypothetical protein
MAGASEHGVSTATAIVLAMLGLGVIAVLVSKQSQSGPVATAGGSAVSRIICTALSPITGGGSCGNLTPYVTSSINFGGIP